MNDVPLLDRPNCSDSANCSWRNASLMTFGEECHNHLPMFFIMAIAYSTIALLGVVGNLALILIIARQREMHNVTNILIANLSVSDLLMAIMCLPFTFVYTFMDHWVFGEAMCKLNSMVQCCSVSVSIFSLVLIAVERYQLIVKPRGWRPSNLQAYIGIGIIWTLAVSTSVPFMLFTLVTDDPLKLLQNFHEEYTGKVVCVEDWPSRKLRLAYTTCMLLLQYIGPLCFIFICYLKIYTRLKKRNIMMDKMRENKYRSGETKRINVMLFSIVVAFAVCWLPLNIFNAVIDWNHEVVMNCHHNPLFSLCHLTAMASVCVNPVFYGFLNKNFQRDLVACRFCKLTSREEDYDTVVMSTMQTDVSKTSLKPESPDI
ncbi:neuropeptide Y receptor type 1-like [Scleropages formosus]|uniref:Neuropeptide Y receptor type 1 n=1 Tax=Scleropages formosus TaxID=113540 RepID=A0A0P7VF96_SCLFO|nr:neuropeptide Y receptor type 1 [Scleropages formosus]XP_018591277.1 neuropeptide Y receptor type 1 [Scleropages formosus]KPP72011.1 neuropeptide Y receptor type 1-like [Scleropages formosus]